MDDSLSDSGDDDDDDCSKYQLAKVWLGFGMAHGPGSDWVAYLGSLSTG